MSTDPSEEMGPMERARSDRWQGTPTPPPAPQAEVRGDDPDSDDVFVDKIFDKNNASLMVPEKESDRPPDGKHRWVRIGEVYSPNQEAGLLPDDLGPADVEQGIHRDCFFITAMAVLSQTPDILRNLFVTKGFKNNGKYVFQFFRWGEWVRVEIDDRIPVDKKGQPLFCRSPNGRQWGVLLEKAFAKFYTCFANIDGGNLAEALHDMAAKPVLNVHLELNGNPDGEDSHRLPAFWDRLAAELRSGHVCATTGSKKVMKPVWGIHGAHAYAVMEVFTISNTAEAKAKGLSNYLIKLVNPSKGDRAMPYRGPYRFTDKNWSEELRNKVGYNLDDPATLFMPVPAFLECFNSLQVCLIDGHDLRWSYEGEWTGDSAGGSSSTTLFRKNPAYLAINRKATDAEVVLTLKQPDQRPSHHLSPDDAEYSYEALGVTVVTQKDQKRPVPTPFLTAHNHACKKPVFHTQRDASTRVVIPANSMVYIVPSTYDAGRASKYQMLLYGNEDEQITLRRLSVDEIETHDKFQVGQGKPGGVQFSTDANTDLHVLLRQSDSAAGSASVAAGSGAKAVASQSDTVAKNYLCFSLMTKSGEPVCGLSPAINYRELSIVKADLPAGEYILAVSCAKQTTKGDTFRVDLILLSASDAKLAVSDERPSEEQLNTNRTAAPRPPAKQSRAKVAAGARPAGGSSSGKAPAKAPAKKTATKSTRSAPRAKPSLGAAKSGMSAVMMDYANLE